MRKAYLLSFLVIGLLVGSVQAQVSVAGEWDGSFNTPGGPRPLKFVLEVDGEKLTGTVKRPSGDLPLTGTIKGDKIEFSYTINYGGNDLTLFFSGKVDGDKMGGIVTIGSTDDNWSATRAAK
ncbi:MAG TPA: hypothetical protein PKD24_11850 [Pyrinomonadaceae bacterium]|nr:hypothetical protein [Pyrinomonadaceae bacterium]HMP65941.1 hypothetical protein [Pyrinomonadaceae bacterium]